MTSEGEERRGEGVGTGITPDRRRGEGQGRGELHYCVSGVDPLFSFCS